MSVRSGTRMAQDARPAWHRALRQYQQADLRKAVWQLANTFIPYLLLWAAMIATLRLGYPYWLTLALSVVAAGLLVRIFIFFHDCCHGSFFASRRANRVLGYVCGILTFTPYDEWRRTHAIHHATAGDLDRRGTGDVWTMTVEEYQGAGWVKRTAYRVFRDPWVLMLLGPTGVFLFANRFTHKGGRRRERFSVWFTNVALLALALVMGLTIGFRAFVAIQLPVIVLAATAGVWLFYVQHQYEGVYWARHEKWNLLSAALEGSSYYKLPKILQWFSGNIGLHHVHHVRPRIPNYSLQRCHDETPELQVVDPLFFGQSLRSLRLHLWDEERQTLISFRSLRKRAAEAS